MMIKVANPEAYVHPIIIISMSSGLRSNLLNEISIQHSLMNQSMGYRSINASVEAYAVPTVHPNSGIGLHHRRRARRWFHLL